MSDRRRTAGHATLAPDHDRAGRGRGRGDRTGPDLPSTCCCWRCRSSRRARSSLFGELLDARGDGRAGGVARSRCSTAWRCSCSWPGPRPGRRRSRSPACLADVRASRRCSGSASSSGGRSPARPRAVATSAALRAKSTSGCTAKNEPTFTTIARNAALESMISRGGEPPIGASPSSAAGRMYIDRMTAR